MEEPDEVKALQLDSVLLKRFKAIAVTNCRRYGLSVYHHADDLVQYACEKLLKKNYAVDRKTLLSIVWKIIENRIRDIKGSAFVRLADSLDTVYETVAEARPSPELDNDIVGFQLPNEDPSPEERLIQRERLEALIAEAERMTGDLEIFLRTRRRDFRDRVRLISITVSGDPDKYIKPSGRLNVRELAEGIGWSENALQKFRGRADEVLHDFGLSFDQLVSIISAVQMAREDSLH